MQEQNVVPTVGPRHWQLNRAGLCLAFFCLVNVLLAVRDEHQQPATDFGHEFRVRLEPARELCPDGVVGFRSDRKIQSRYELEWYSTQYVLAPAVVTPDNLKWFSVDYPFAAASVTQATDDACQILSIHLAESGSIAAIGADKHVKDLGLGIHLIPRSDR